MISSTLSPLWSPRVRAQQPPAKAAPVSVPSVFAPSAPAAPSVPAEVQRRVAIETLTIDDVTGLSVASVNSLVPHRPDLIGELVVRAGKMRRAELPMDTFAMRPIARAIVLSGERRRGRELNEEEAAFMAEFLETIAS
jgi:hypothetical protein